MSLSTLPDLFKQSTMALKPMKQGGQFSLYLTNSSEKPKISGKALRNTADATSLTGSDHRRSFSSGIITISKDLSSTKIQKEPIWNPRPKITSSSSAAKPNNIHSQLGRMMGLIWQQQSFNQRGLNRIVKQKMSRILGKQGFPNETTRGFNNQTIALEEAQSMKNNMESAIQQSHNLDISLQCDSNELSKIQHELCRVYIELGEVLDYFESQFTKASEQLYNKLSFLRRKTNAEIKQHKSMVAKLEQQFEDAVQIIENLDSRANQMRQNCLDGHRVRSSDTLTQRSFCYKGRSGEYRPIQSPDLSQLGALPGECMWQDGRVNDDSHSQNYGKMINGKQTPLCKPSGEFL